jgi:hypothetical protein
LSSDKEIAEVYHQEIQEKTNLVKRKSGLLPFLNEYSSYDPEDPDSLSGFHVLNLYEGIADSDDRKLLNNLYCQALEEEKEEIEEQE